MLAAGHDEDKDKARIGTPMERLMMMVSCSLLHAAGACLAWFSKWQVTGPLSCSWFLSGGTPATSACRLLPEVAYQADTSCCYAGQGHAGLRCQVPDKQWGCTANSRR